MSEGQGQQKMQGIGFAVKQLRNGNSVFRWGWNGKGMYLSLQRPDSNSKMMLPYIYMSTVKGEFVPWVASQTDLLAEDWEVLPVNEQSSRG